MKLRIRYKDSIHAPANAVFLRGTDPLTWLREIDKWNIAIEELECYILPSSLQSVDASGLFVLFKDSAKIKDLSLKEAYTCIEKRLFIPCNAEIIPQVNRNELNKILLWDKQIFHPVIGLIGVEAKDQTRLIDLLYFEEPSASDWSFSHPGIPSKPQFNEIRIINPTANELIDSIKKEIGEKPLEELSKKDREESVFQKLLDRIRYVGIKGVAEIVKLAGKILPEGDASDSEGIFQRFEKWVFKNLAELEKKRRDEIKRLLDLFDKNTNEALQYAIPLDSPYLNRGTETPSYKLTKRPLQFNLGNLVGGARVDVWDIGNYYSDLRTKYINAAQKAIEGKDFKKAAYVYAHLLGDYTSAANTLEQGKMYREAAALYKDHLRNITAAADCLERGGLYLESIELNKVIGRDEKTGDLYKRLNQEQNAVLFFEKHIATKLSLNDHFDAARVIDEKMNEKERAQQVLLEGWNHSYQHEACLKKYFEIVAETQPGDISAKIKNIYTNSTPRHKNMPLLNVLEYLNKLRQDETVKETTNEVMYEIIHKEIKTGNAQSVHSLKRFLPEDKLIGSDASRYISNIRNRPARHAAPCSFQLDASIKWIKAVWHRNQFLVIGIKNSCLHMARGNWYGNFEYYTWINPVKSNAKVTLINTPYHSNYVFVHFSDGLPITRKNLPRNKYFNDALIVCCPVWLHQGPAQFVINDDGTICRLDTGSNITLHHYSMVGDLKRSVSCFIDGKDQALGHAQLNAGFIHHDGYYYTFWDKVFVVISNEGKTREFLFEPLIRFFASSIVFAEFRIIISTNNGCLLYKPSNGLLNLQGGFFAEQLVPSLIVFVQTDRFVIAEKLKAFLFEIKDEMTQMIREYDTHSHIVAILPTSARNQFALIEESGKITICEVDV